MPKGVWLQIGYCDFLDIEINDLIYTLWFTEKKVKLFVKDTGKIFIVQGLNIGGSFKREIGLNDKVIITSIGYTTKRVNEIIRYKHDFSNKARPQLKYLTRNTLVSLGGGFQFNQLGFVDNKARSA